MNYRLSYRLEYIRSQLVPGLHVWDLCCDHGLLGNAALENHPEVYFVDQVPHVTKALIERLQDRAGAHVICADATLLENTVTGNVVIAGVGGNKIIKILSHLISSGRLQARRLILSPHRDEDEVLTFLSELKEWKLSHTYRVGNEKRTWLVAVFDCE